MRHSPPVSGRGAWGDGGGIACLAAGGGEVAGGGWGPGRMGGRWGPMWNVNFQKFGMCLLLINR